MRYTLIKEMRETLDALQKQLQAFCQQLAELPLAAARTFILPAPLKGQELTPTPNIHVEALTGQPARHKALDHLQQLFMQQQSETVSTRSAVRLPGALCVKTSLDQQQRLHELCETINQLKSHFQKLVTVDSGLPSTARFPFVHQHFPGLITLNAYRSVTLLPAPDSIHFGWANKHVIKRFSRDAIIEQLEKSLQAKRARAPWTREQWAKHVSAELDLVRSLPAKARLKIKRPVKVQPIARTWQGAQQKQTQFACPSPLIVTCPPGTTIPEIGGLLNYDEENILHRHKPDAQPATLLIPRLWLWQVYD